MEDLAAPRDPTLEVSRWTPGRALGSLYTVMSPLDEILVAFGGNAILLVVLGFLARSLIQTWLAKDLKKFEADLQNTAASQLELLRHDLKSQGETSIEQLKSRLQQATTEHQVRFAKLHEKRASVIEDLDARLYRLEIEGQRYVERVGQSGEEGYLKWREQFIDCNSFLHSKRIYLTEQIFGQISEYLDAVKRPAIEVWAITCAGEDASGPSHDLLRRYSGQILSAIEEANTKIPAMRSVLIKEFRAILGGPDNVA